jgi:hypothetical protein
VQDGQDFDPSTLLRTSLTTDYTESGYIIFTTEARRTQRIDRPGAALLVGFGLAYSRNKTRFLRQATTYSNATVVAGANPEKSIADSDRYHSRNELIFGARSFPSANGSLRDPRPI